MNQPEVAEWEDVELSIEIEPGETLKVIENRTRFTQTIIVKAKDIDGLTDLLSSHEEKVRADWLRSEIEKLEGMKVTHESRYCGHISNDECEDCAHNQALTSIITRYKEELKVLETQI